MSGIVSELCTADGENDAEGAATVGKEEDKYCSAATKGQFGVLRWWGFEGTEAG